MGGFSGLISGGEGSGSSSVASSGLNFTPCTQRTNGGSFGGYAATPNASGIWGNTLTWHPIPKAVQAFKVRFGNIIGSSGADGERSSTTPAKPYTLRASVWFRAYHYISSTSISGTTISVAGNPFTANDLIGRTLVTWYNGYQSAEILGNTTNTITISAWPVGVPSGNVVFNIYDIIPLTFAGNRSVLLEPDTMVDSDPLEIYLPDNSQFWVCTNSTATAGNYWPCLINDGQFSSNDEWSEAGTGTNVDLTLGGWVNGVSGGAGVAPLTVLGIPQSGSSNAIFAFMDSLGAAVGDTNQFYRGIFGRLLYSLNCPGFVIGSPGSTTVNMRALSRNKFSLENARGCKHAFYELAVNDPYDSVPLPDTQASMLQVWQVMAGKGCIVIARTPSPRTLTTSSDAWTTLVNQTPHSSEAARVAICTWLRDPSGAGAVAQAATLGIVLNVWDSSPSQESSLNSGLWKPGNVLYSGIPITGNITSNSFTIAGTATDQANPTYPFIADANNSTMIKITSGSGSFGGNGVGGTSIFATFLQQNTLSGQIQIFLGTNFTVNPSVGDTFSVVQAVTTDGVHPAAAAAFREVNGPNGLAVAGMFL